jgi:hypothetical protein
MPRFELRQQRANQAIVSAVHIVCDIKVRVAVRRRRGRIQRRCIGSRSVPGTVARAVRHGTFWLRVVLIRPTVIAAATRVATRHQGVQAIAVQAHPAINEGKQQRDMFLNRTRHGPITLTVATDSCNCFAKVIDYWCCDCALGYAQQNWHGARAERTTTKKQLAP